MRPHRVHDPGAHGAREALVPFREALGMALDAVRPMHRTEAVALGGALRRVAAADVKARMDVPASDRAAMDGYAVVARDTEAAGASRPVVLRCLEALYADGPPMRPVSSGYCTEVATGAAMPKGADAVVMVERTDREDERVRVYAPVEPGKHVSPRGEDIERGSLVVRAGDVLAPARLGALAAAGVSRVRVYRKPRVSILTTGDEIVPLGRPLRPGQVYDVNSRTIAAVVAENGGEPRRLGRVGDRVEALRAALRRALAADLVVVSGGSSVGRKDLVAEVLREEGKLLFHGIAVKPGRPTALALVDDKPVLGMPGYMTSCLTNAYVLLAPMLRKLARLPPAVPRAVEVPLAEAVRSPPGKVEFRTVRVEGGRAIPAFKGSSTITSMAHADGYIEIPEDVEAVEAGEWVRVVLF